MKLRLLILALALFCPAVQADVVVIVHPSNTVALEQEQIQQLFLGKTKVFPDNRAATPYDQSEDNEARNTFYQRIIGKKGNQLRAYWSRLVFTGKGRPPKELGNDSAVRAQVASNAAAIGYIDRKYVDASVRVVYQIP